MGIACSGYRDDGEISDQLVEMVDGWQHGVENVVLTDEHFGPIVSRVRGVGRVEFESGVDFRNGGAALLRGHYSSFFERDSVLSERVCFDCCGVKRTVLAALWFAPI